MTTHRTATGGAALAAILALTSMSIVHSPVAAADDAVCATLTRPIYQSTNPRLETDLLTPWQGEYENSQARYGYTENTDLLGQASLHPASGLTEVTRMYNPRTVDFQYAVGPEQVKRAEAKGFVAQGNRFYVATQQASCTTPVYWLTKGTNSRQVTTSVERQDLIKAGWSDGGVLFHVKSAPASTPTPKPTTTPSLQPTPKPTTTPTSEPGPTQQPAPPNGTGTFSIAIIPDTQVEAVRAEDNRFPNRTKWLAANKDALNLKYVLHTGDITNWGWVSPDQFKKAKDAATTLRNAGIPYVWASGNHDTAVVGHNGVRGSRLYGGSAYVNNPECPEKLRDQCRSWLLVRDTGVYNKYFPLSEMRNVGGTFEPGKADNVYTTFEAGGAKWMVLTLELWPRKEAVAWADKVVASHPNHNVIVQTHAYLNGGGSIDGSNGGYGSTSGRYVFDNLIKRHANIKMVFSGHTGEAAHRVDTGVNGNTIVSYLGNFASNGDKGTKNPTRIVKIDVASGKVTSEVRVPSTGGSMPQYATSHTLSFRK